MELHHPIMSKLWDLGGRTQRRRKKKVTFRFLQIIDIQLIRNEVYSLVMWVSIGFPWSNGVSVSTWLYKTFMIYGLCLYLLLKSTAIIYNNIFYNTYSGYYFLLLAVTKIFSWYRTLCSILLKGKDYYSALFFQKKWREKRNIEDAWNEVDSLMVLNPQICTYCLDSLWGCRLMFHMKWGYSSLMFMHFFSWSICTIAVTFVNNHIIIKYPYFCHKFCNICQSYLYILDSLLIRHS